MSLSVGIVGLPNSGKSTLFNALLSRQIAQVGEYPFTTIKPNTGVVEVPDKRLEKLARLLKPEKAKPNTGVVEVPDKRLEKLARLLKPEKAIPAAVKFVDIAGLVKGAYRGEGLGNRFLSHIREVDAIVHVLRVFENPNVSHPFGKIDPVQDAEIVNLELSLAGIEKPMLYVFNVSENQIGKTSQFLAIARFCDEFRNRNRKGDRNGNRNGNKGRKDKKTGERKEDGRETEERKTGERKKDEGEIDEGKMGEGKTGKEEVDENGRSKERSINGKELEGEEGVIKICAKLEADLADLSEKERKEYLKETGIKYSGLDRLIQAAYRLLDLITFFTIKGGRQVQAWPLKKGSTALDAAGLVHSDFAKGFVKAEVISFDCLLACGSWQQAGREGKLRIEGRDYQIQDGEVVEFKVNP